MELCHLNNYVNSIIIFGPGLVVYACNPSYSGARDQENPN
jgi:hypothetical protein